MGYYSEISLCLNKAAHTKMMAELETKDEKVKQEFQELLTHAQKEIAYENTNDESYLYYWPWVKWYSHFPCVGFVEQFVNRIDNEDETEESELQYRLLSVGEMLEDNEDRGNYYDNPFETEILRGINFENPSNNLQEGTK